MEKPRPVAPPPPAPRPVAPKLLKKEPPAISLKELKQKEDNQRKPDQKNVSAMRDALKAMVGEPSKTKEKLLEPKPSALIQPVAKKEPTPEELKKLLGV